jgi:hypothetical protein
LSVTRLTTALAFEQALAAFFRREGSSTIAEQRKHRFIQAIRKLSVFFPFNLPFTLDSMTFLS